MTGSKLTEDDFVTEVTDLDTHLSVPILVIGEDEWLAAYGHLDKDEFLDHCNTWLDYYSGSDPNAVLSSEDEVLWTWAVKKDNRYDGWTIEWGKKVDPQDDDAFPITLVNTW